MVERLAIESKETTMHAMATAQSTEKFTAPNITERKALYAELAERLRIPNEFHTRYAHALRTKFREAAAALRNNSPNAINQCLHVASCVALRQDVADLHDATQAASESTHAYAALQEHDPAIILTIATLRHLLEHVAERCGADDDVLRAVDEIQRRFDSEDWFVGSDAMKILGIERFQHS